MATAPVFDSVPAFRAPESSAASQELESSAASQEREPLA
jgi:hypothetical protein